MIKVIKTYENYENQRRLRKPINIKKTNEGKEN